MTISTDLEDRSLVHLTRVPVCHINRINWLHAISLSILDHFVGELAFVRVREVNVSENIDAGLHSADR